MIYDRNSKKKMKRIMKLSIRSSIGQALQKILQGSGSNYCFRFGYMTRDGFVPYINRWQQRVILNSLLSHKSVEKREFGLFQDICHIGQISSHWLVLGKTTVRSGDKTPFVDCGDYGIHFTDSYIQVELYGAVTTLEGLFKPIKDIYGLMGTMTIPVPCCIGVVFGEARWSATSLKFESFRAHKIKAEKSWVIMPPGEGERASLIITNKNIYLILCGGKFFKINSKVPNEYVDTTLHGHWYRDMFTVNDATTIKGQDVKDRSLSYRLSLAKRSILSLAFCKVIKLYSATKVNQRLVLENHGGFVFVSDNNRALVYISPNRISVFLRATPTVVAGLPFYFYMQALRDDIFRGTKIYPYHSPAPLSHEDRVFIRKFPENSVFEFRWEDDNLVPYALSTSQFINPEKNKKHWELLHESVSYQDLFKSTELSPKAPMIAHKRKPLKMLSVNKSVVFYSPMEGEDVLVRTGTIGEGSCLFHALLHAYSKDYATMDRKGRMKFVRRLRASMAGKVNTESWEDMGGGVISKVPYQENVHDILHNLYNFIEKGGSVRGRSTRRVIKKLSTDDKKMGGIYQILIELVSFHVLTSNILPCAYDRTQDARISQCNIAVIEEALVYLRGLGEMKQLADKKVAYIESKISELLSVVLKEAKNSAYRAYIKGLEES